MTVRNPLLTFLQTESIVSRRKALVATGAGVVALLAAPRLFAHDDDDDHHGHRDHDDDDNHDHDRDDDFDDDDIRPIGEVPAGSFEVRIDDDDADGFEPGDITVDVGQSVTWVNLDDDPHTATSGEFDTGIMQPGELVTVIFDTPGTFPYACQIHPIMTGQVNVRDADGQVPDNRSTTPESSSQASPAAGTGAPAQVTIVDLRFEPAEIRIAARSTVTWTNEDPLPHTATADDGSFDSGTLQQGDTFNHSFENPGTFAYTCAIHPSMRGTVIVEENP